MIGRGARGDAERAVRLLREASRASGIRLPALDVDPLVWDSAAGGVRLVELGSVAPATAVRLAYVLRRAALPSSGAPIEAAPEGGPDLAPGSMAYPPCACPRCRTDTSCGPGLRRGADGAERLSVALGEVNRRSTRGLP